MKRVLLKPRFEGLDLHVLYKELIQNPPPEFAIEYHKASNNNSFYIIDNKSSSPLLKEFLFYAKPIPYILLQTMTNTNFYDYDLIYASQHVLFNMKGPWICDLEFANALAAYGNISMIRSVISNALANKHCKFILPWSYWAKDTLLRSIDCSNLLDKIKVVHYTVNPKSFTKEKHDGVNFLFVGSSNPMNVRNIQFKNLREVIIAFDNIAPKYDNVNLIIRSYLPEPLKNLAKKNKAITVIDKFLSKEELDLLYKKADVFVLPSHETMGTALLDAMSFELPVIAMNLYDIPELINHMENGILLTPPAGISYYDKNGCPPDYSRQFNEGITKYSTVIIKQLEEYFCTLIENKQLRLLLARNARESIENGTFSIQKRNEELRKVFESATNS